MNKWEEIQNTDKLHLVENFLNSDCGQGYFNKRSRNFYGMAVSLLDDLRRNNKINSSARKHNYGSSYGNAIIINTNKKYEKIRTVQTTKKSPPPSKSADEIENEILRKRISELEKQNQSQPKQVAKRPSPKKSPPPKSGTTGSGFFVSKLGHILTNEHVVRECGSVTVGDNANKQVRASILEKDKRNDLALLRISSTQMASAETLSLISKLGAQKLGLKLVPLASGGLMRSNDIELGESVMVAGYPYGELYSNTIKVTGGMVSAVKGMGDDSAQFQMDAAVQPGNSGGPIYDENGNIVGVVISQLNKFKVAKAIGSLPENVNFGIKASTVRQFLTSAGLPTKWSNRTERKSTKELAQIAKNQTVMVVCNP
jgi:S1-C subfamily serine protease